MHAFHSALVVVPVLVTIFADAAIGAQNKNPFQFGQKASGQFAQTSRYWKPLSIQHCSLPSGTVKDTCCRYSTASGINNRLLPILSQLVQTTVFRYFKVDLERPCPFWNEELMCVLSDCTVVEAVESEIPIKWRQAALSAITYDSAANGTTGSNNTATNPSQTCASSTSIRDFCILDDDMSQTGHYVDLIKNPERYTGYNGDSSARIWRAIYSENCFSGPESSSSMGGDQSGIGGLDQETCLEKRVFYKLISGLHSSISIHICDEWLDRATGQWGPNLECYINRIAYYPDRLENLYFIWAVATRAVSKLSPYLRNHPFCEETQDADLVKQHVNQVAEIVATCPSTFDETVMFSDTMMENASLKQEFQRRFRNISMIMDCVGCDKCRLWGKLQVAGLGTALKVLFSEQDSAGMYRLTRAELVALMNGYHRLSESLVAVERFQAMIAKEIGLEDKIRRRVVEEDDLKAESVQKVQEGAKKDISDRLTVEKLLEHTSFFEPRRVVMYVVGIFVFVMGLLRVVQLGYSKNLGQMMAEAKKKQDEEEKKKNE